jgi:branched-chain amino acid transport system substrate-binding protein
MTPIRSLRGLAAATLVLLAGCGREAPPRPEADVIRLGFAAPLTGAQSHYGEDMRNGVTLAIEETNAGAPVIGGRPVRFELLAEDDQADPARATLVAQKLVDAGIRGMLGHFNSGTSIPAAAIYAQAGIPQLAMATAPAYTAQGHRTAFRMMTSDVQQGAALGRFAVETLGLKRIAVVDDRSAYGEGLAEQFSAAVRAAGGEIVAREFTSDRATDFAAILTAIKRARPDAVFFGGADAQAAPMARQMRQLGLPARLLGGEMIKSPAFLSMAGAAGEGTVASLAGLPLERMPGGEAFAHRHQARFGKPVQVYAPYAYDGAVTLIEAMKRADASEPARVLPELARTRRAGVTSTTITYDANGDLGEVAITLYEVRGGQWAVLQTATR